MYDVKDEMRLLNKEEAENISLRTAQLEPSCSALDFAHLELEKEHKKVESLTGRVNSFEPMKLQPLLEEEELQRHENLLEESSMSQLHSKYQLL